MRETQVIVALARNTMREAFRSPLLLFVGLVFALLIAFSPQLTLFGFGAERTMVRELGLASLRLFGFLVVLVFGSSLIPGDRQAGRLALLRARPVSWRGYLLGRYLGLCGAVLLPFVALFALFCGMLALTDGLGGAELSLLLSGTALTLLEVMVLAAVALCLSSVLPLVLAWLGVLAMFLLGHLEPWIQATLESMGSGYGWLATILSLPIPDLQGLDIAPSVAVGEPVSWTYVATACGFGALYLVGYLLLTRAVVEGWEIA